MQERRNSSALAMELRFPCINTSLCFEHVMVTKYISSIPNYRNMVHFQAGLNLKKKMFEQIHVYLIGEFVTQRVLTMRVSLPIRMLIKWCRY